MTKTEMREVAKDVLMDAIACAYYKLEDMGYSYEENEQIEEYITQYGTTMAKSIHQKFYTL